MKYNHGNVNLARTLRKEMTPWERKLWYCFLSKYPVRFQRQKPIEGYIVDFYCAKARLIVELDGGGHYNREAFKKDSYRAKKLEELGMTIIRFCNLDIDRNFYGVCTVIDNEVNKKIRERSLGSLSEGAVTEGD